MAKPLEPGMKFLVPLPDGRFLPGYVVVYGNLFTLVNIFSNAQDDKSEPECFPQKDLFLRDFMVGDHVFSKSKRVIDVPWILFRTKRVRDPLPPGIEGIVIGESGLETVKDLATGKISRSASKEDLKRLPRHGIKVASYYSLAVEAALLGKVVKLDPDSRHYFIS